MIKKYWNRLRFTERDADRRLRGECISVASRFETKNIADLLRGAQLVYDWLEGGAPPADKAETL
jgi:hypothetical protein